MTRHYLAGRLNGVHAEPVTGETLVVVDNDDRGCTVAYATDDDISAATARLADGDVRSVAEHTAQRALRTRRA